MSTPLLDTPEYQAAARYVDFYVEKQALQKRLDEINEQLKTLQPALLGFLTALGQKRFVVKDCLLSTAREPWVYPITGVTRQQVCEGLKLSGLGRMVKENYSTQSLTKYIKDLEAHHKLVAGLQPKALEKLLPPGLAPLLNVVPAYKIKVTRQAEDDAPVFESEEYEQETNDDSRE